MDFLKAKFDNLSLVVMFFVLIGVMMWFQEKLDDKVVAWLQQTITTVLGTYLGLTQAHRLINKNGNGGTNGSQTPTTAPDVSVIPGAVLPTYPKS
jgi:hypothetical protein